MTIVTTAHREERRLRTGWWLGAVAAVVLLTYRPVLQVLLSGDDFIILHLVRQAGGLRHPWAYFSPDLFAYYRPIAFVSQAIDWQIWGEQPFGYHLTSLALHTLNTMLVFAIAGRLFGRVEAVAASLLFALHPSNHEAVFWMAARFDLLATCFMLAALVALMPRRLDGTWFMDGGGRLRYLLGIGAFTLALLSKESALAFPLIAVACDVFLARRSGRDAVLRLLPLLAVTVAYVALRVVAGSSDGGGMSHAAKAIGLAGGLCSLVLVAMLDPARAIRAVAERHRTRVALAAVVVAVVAGANLLPAAAAWLGPRLAFACFTGFYLVSPVITVGGSPPIAFDPDNTIIRVGGVAAVIAAAACLALAWSRETPTDGKTNRVLAFLFVFLAGALLPVSSMTEGKRYLYLASVGMALLAALVLNRLRGRSRIAALAVAAALVAVSGWQIQLKAGDWTWAGTMTRDAVRTIRTLTPDPCRGRNVMFLTAPVNIRDVYCNFYDYTFEDPSTRCVPETVRAVVRVVGNDVQTTARWADPKTLVFATRGQADRLLTSTDLRSFDMPLAQGAAGRLRLPIGSLAVRSDTSGRDFELNLAAEVDPRQWHFLYYGSGAVHRVPAAPPNGGR